MILPITSFAVIFVVLLILALSTSLYLLFQNYTADTTENAQNENYAVSQQLSPSLPYSPMVELEQNRVYRQNLNVKYVCDLIEDTVKDAKATDDETTRQLESINSATVQINDVTSEINAEIILLRQTNAQLQETITNNEEQSQLVQSKLQETIAGLEQSLAESQSTKENLDLKTQELDKVLASLAVTQTQVTTITRNFSALQQKVDEYTANEANNLLLQSKLKERDSQLRQTLELLSKFQSLCATYKQKISDLQEEQQTSQLQPSYRR